jgi:hypothetical protein
MPWLKTHTSSPMLFPQSACSSQSTKPVEELTTETLLPFVVLEEVALMVEDELVVVPVPAPAPPPPPSSTTTVPEHAPRNATTPPQKKKLRTMGGV